MWDDAKDYLNDLGIAVVTEQLNYAGNNTVIQVSPEVGTEYTQEGSDSVVTLYYN